jgi:hypothetical protein
MTLEQWQRVESLVRAALERPAAERPDFLKEGCAGDEELRRKAESLLSFRVRAEAEDFAEGALGERPRAGCRVPSASRRWQGTCWGSTGSSVRVHRLPRRKRGCPRRPPVGINRGKPEGWFVPDMAVPLIISSGRCKSNYQQ